MISALVFLLVIFPAYFIYKNIVDLRANIAAAKQSGLPYSVARELGPLAYLVRY